MSNGACNDWNLHMSRIDTLTAFPRLRLTKEMIWLRNSSASQLEFDWHMLISLDWSNHICSVWVSRSLTCSLYACTVTYVCSFFVCQKLSASLSFWPSVHTESSRILKNGHTGDSLYTHTAHSFWAACESPQRRPYRPLRTRANEEIYVMQQILAAMKLTIWA